jgi:two-component system, chemotaxis family, sensor kinase Cph1
MFDGRRVLVVEDEYLAALATIDFLESIGCEVVGPAARLSDALYLAHSEDLDAALLDINLADEMVWPVAEILRLKPVPFLFLSAFSQLNVLPELFAHIPSLPKPLAPERLLRHLRAIWDGPDRRAASRQQHRPGP